MIFVCPIIISVFGYTDVVRVQSAQKAIATKPFYVPVFENGTVIVDHDRHFRAAVCN